LLCIYIILLTSYEHTDVKNGEFVCGGWVCMLQLF